MIRDVMKSAVILAGSWWAVKKTLPILERKFLEAWDTTMNPSVRRP